MFVSNCGFIESYYTLKKEIDLNCMDFLSVGRREIEKEGGRVKHCQFCDKSCQIVVSIGTLHHGEISTTEVGLCSFHLHELRDVLCGN